MIYPYLYLFQITKRLILYKTIESTLGCPILLKIHKIYLSNKYFIPVYKRIYFPNFQNFPASFRVPTVKSKNTKDFLNLKRKNVSDALFNYLILKQFFSTTQINGWYTGLNASLDNKISKNVIFLMSYAS